MDKKRIIKTDKAPEAIGPYSQAVAVGNMLYCSGQIPLDPVTQEIVGNSVTEQTKQVLKNIKAVLQCEGCHLEDVVKCSIFITSMDHFQDVNAVYGRFFEVNPPARETVAVRGLPKGVLVEISCIAVLK